MPRSRRSFAPYIPTAPVGVGFETPEGGFFVRTLFVAPHMWETDYRHDRRAHRHRCHCCMRIVSAGERVLMWRVAKGTKLVHIECADKPHPCGTFRDAITEWSKP